jgi:hypothetical protein
VSVQAISWALKQPIAKSSEKFVLVVMCNYADENGCCYPSITALSAATAQDRKTVIANLKSLSAAGKISDTGRRVGATGQVVVYQINSTEIGPVEESQKRNGSENGTVPLFPSNSTVFPSKQSQKRDTNTSGTRQGTVSTRKRKPSPKHPIPEDFDLTPERQAYAEKHLPHVDPIALMATFRSTSKAKGWMYADWDQHWQTLVRQWAPNSGHWSSGAYPKKAEQKWM